MSSRFYDFLDRIGDRPALYIGEKSITSLRGWVDGWTAALGEECFIGTRPPFSEFHDWVALRLGFRESTSGWKRMLLERHQGDEEAAFDSFFSLFNEFRGRQERIILYANVDPSRKPSDWVDTEELKYLPWPHRLEIIKYTVDKGVFVRFIDSDGNPYRQEYCPNLHSAFFRSDSFVDKGDWHPQT